MLYIRIVPEWNVKNETAPSVLLLHCIRIVPEWNVKTTDHEKETSEKKIRIVPEWNVKHYDSVRASVRGINQNRTRVECKDTETVNITTDNVLESYQSGM